MRFTLSIEDYLDQYVKNKETGDTHCPICYEQVMSDNKSNNITHLIECYKTQVLELELTKYYEEHGALPSSVGDYVDDIMIDIEHELARYCFKYESII